MKSKAIDLRTLITKKGDPIQRNVYELLRSHRHILHEPEFTIKNVQTVLPDITYRKINDWDNKNIISGSRQKEASGWRKFSVVDVVKLCIISDLREIGIDTNKIKNIIGKCSDDSMPLLEHSIFLSLNEEKILLIIDGYEKVTFGTEANAVFSHFYLARAEAPILILPFFLYIEKILSIMKESITFTARSTIKHAFNTILSTILTAKESKIIEIIRDKNYEELTIINPTGKEFRLKAKTRKRGSFSDKDVVNAIKSKEYQNISVSTVGGKTVSIVREETIKV